MKKLNWDKIIPLTALVIIFIVLVVMSNLNDDLSSERDLMMMDRDSTQLELTIAQDEIQALQTYNSELKEELVIMEDQIHAMRKEVERVNNELNEFIEDSSNWFRVRYNPTKEELSMMYRLIEAEVTGFGLEEKLNVAHVIINRVYSDDFPDTIEEVIFQDRQFSCIPDGRYYKVSVTKSSVDAVNLAIQSNDTTYGSLFFMNKSASDSDNVSWFENKLEFVMNDNSGHSFWR